MNQYSVFSLLSAFICLATGITVYQRATDKPMYRLFFVETIAVSLWCLAGFGLSQADSFEEALLWGYFFKLWPICVAVGLHFVIYYLGLEELGRRIFLKMLLYGSAAIVLAIELSTDLVSGQPHLEYWGWAPAIPAPNPASIACYAWFFALWLALLYFTIRHGFFAPDNNNRKRAKILFLSFICPISASLLEAGFYLHGERLPPLSSALVFVLFVGVGHGIWKYDIFALSPVRAAQEIVSTMADCLLLIDPRGSITTANRAALDLLGYNEGEIRGRPIEIILVKKDATHEQLLKMFDPSHADKVSLQDRETLLKHKSGSKIPVSLSGAVLKTSRGKPKGLILIGRDISRRKQEEEEKKTIEQQLFRVQKIDSIGRLAGGVAHDMNNLLSIIVGAAAVLSDDIESGTATKEQLLETIDALNTACRRGSDLTRNLLGFAREGKYVKQLFCVNQAIEQVKSLLDHSAPKQIEISTRLAEGLSWVSGDKSQIEQVVLNICINALDAIEGYGKLTIETENVHCTAEKDSRLFDIEPGEYVRVRITDTGAGIEPALKEKVFEPFFTTKQRKEGTGLGLAMVYGTIRNHQGTVKLDSVLGLGTSVEVYLPASKKPPVPQQIESENIRISRPSSPGVSISCCSSAAHTGILLVDDEDMIRRSSGRLLRNRGYEVFLAKNGVEAVELFKDRQDEIGLVILDMVMPELDGPGTFHILKEMDSNVKVIIHSGYDKDERVDDLITAGAKAFVPKPFDPEAFFNTITDVLST